MSAIYITRGFLNWLSESSSRVFLDDLQQKYKLVQIGSDISSESLRLQVATSFAATWRIGGLLMARLIRTVPERRYLRNLTRMLLMYTNILLVNRCDDEAQSTLLLAMRTARMLLQPSRRCVQSQ